MELGTSQNVFPPSPDLPHSYAAGDQLCDLRHPCDCQLPGRLAIPDAKDVEIGGRQLLIAAVVGAADDLASKGKQLRVASLELAEAAGASGPMTVIVKRFSDVTDAEVAEAEAHEARLIARGR